MARSADTLSRIDVLVLSTLARAPMHGYELKLELRYKHVQWWAKCEHGHLYAALTRLERRGDIKHVRGENGNSQRRVYALTPAGQRRAKRWLEELATADDGTYFDVDLFLAGAFLLDRDRAVAILEQRRKTLQGQLAEATALKDSMGGYVPAVARLIMQHRIDHLAREIAFSDTAAEALRAEATWGPFLGQEPIGEFLQRTRAPVEPAAPRRGLVRGKGAARSNSWQS